MKNEGNTHCQFSVLGSRFSVSRFPGSPVVGKSRVIEMVAECQNGVWESRRVRSKRRLCLTYLPAESSDLAGLGCPLEFRWSARSECRVCESGGCSEHAHRKHDAVRSGGASDAGADITGPAIPAKLKNDG